MLKDGMHFLPRQGYRE